MADPITKDEFEKFKKDFEEFRKLVLKIIPFVRRFSVKAYPQFKMPETGDLFSKGSSPNIPVKVKSNKPGLLHWIEFRHENMDPVTMVPRVQLVFGGGGIGDANIMLPDPGNYLLICYIDGDNVLMPVHHVAKIDITVNP